MCACLLAAGLAVGVISFNATCAQNDSTITFGYFQSHNITMKDSVNDFYHITNVYKDNINIGAYTTPYKPSKGWAFSYRYEFTPEWGVISRLSYIGANFGMQLRNGQQWGVVADELVRGKTQSQQWGVMVGPTYRVNDYASLYGMGGLNIEKITSSLTVSDNANTLLGLNLQSKHETSHHIHAAYSVGVQFNYSGYALDISYMGAGTGHAQVNGYSVGLGYTF